MKQRQGRRDGKDSGRKDAGPERLYKGAQAVTETYGKIEKYTEIAYYILLVWFLAYRTFFNTMFRKDFGIKRAEGAETAWLVLMAALILFKLLKLQYYSRAEIAVSCILILLGILVRRTSDTYWILMFPLLTVGAKKVPFDRILKLFLITVGGMLAVTVAAACAGLITNLVYLQPEADGSLRVRSAYGTTYPTTFSEFVFFLSCAWLYLRRKKLNLVDLVLCGAVGVFLKIKCDAKTDALCMLLLAAVTGWIMVRGKLPEKAREIFRRLSAVLIAAMPLMAGWIILAARYYNPDNPLLSRINTILNTRLSLGKKGFRKYGLSLLGTTVKYKTTGGKLEEVKNYFNLDSSYLMILINFGILMFLVLLALFVWSSYRAREEQDVLLLLLLTVIAAESFMENRLIQAQYDIFLLIFFASLRREDGRSFCMLELPRSAAQEGAEAEKGEGV